MGMGRPATIGADGIFPCALLRMEGRFLEMGAFQPARARLNKVFDNGPRRVGEPLARGTGGRAAFTCYASSSLMALIGWPRCARSTFSTSSSDGGASHWRLPTCSPPSNFIVRLRRSSRRLTDTRTPTSPMANVSPGLSADAHSGGHTETTVCPDLRLR